MRYKFAEIIQRLALKDKQIIFLTGDLGFNVFEPLQKTLKTRFINAGVAEHNMMTVAAGLTHAGFKPWVYSIAPFVTIKVLEEIRNDLCAIRANVKIVGLGGGYDYGMAGPTHHALEDIAVLRTLPYMKIYTPCSYTDLEMVIAKMHQQKTPEYLRLTKAEELPLKLPPYAACRRVIKGKKITVMVLGSMIGTVLKTYLKLNQKYQKAVDLWTVSELPFTTPTGLINSIKGTRTLCVIEEHVSIGGLGQYISSWILQKKLPLKDFCHLFARPERSKKYGDRDFYLKQTALDPASIVKIIKTLYDKN